MNSDRRKLLKALAVLPVFAGTKNLYGFPDIKPGVKIPEHNLKISLNAFSFNEPLSKGTMSLDDLLDFCADTIIQAVDLTGYYFPGYPGVPPDEYIYHIKNKAFRLGLDISGTGIRNDFTEADVSKRREYISLIKNWIVCASKLGAPVIRIFAGSKIPDGYTWDQVAGWMMQDVEECVDFGKEHGVIIGIQNHNDFIKTSEDVHKIMGMLSSEWFGLILDTGSYRTGDPYAEIAATAKYAVNWQLKENVFVNGKEVPADLHKIFKAIKNSGYRGYLPIETLGEGDPKKKIIVFLEKIQTALHSIILNRSPDKN
ncbi:sugar phosphate isomerase/epimerase [soil metagenome]